MRKFNRFPPAWSMGLCLLFVMAFSLPAPAADQLQVKDGDSFLLNGVEYRLSGIDAPEWDQPCQFGELVYFCGRVAQEFLKSLIGDESLRCEAQPKSPKEPRTVAICYVRGEDLGALMVRHGWAIEWERYSKGRYREELAAAKSAARGVWAGTFELPWEWRHAHRE